VKLTVRAVFEPPASWSAKKREAAIGRHHLQKPDLDNIEKAISDGMNRIAYADDSQICCKRSVKLWGRHAETVITVEEVEA